MIDTLRNKANSLRKTNLFRHHYIAQPLVNYTSYSDENNYNLLKFNIDINQDFIDKKLEYSPRYIYFSEFTLFYNVRNSFNASRNGKKEKEYTTVQNLFFESNKKEKPKKSVLDDAFDQFFKTNYFYRKTWLKNLDDNTLKNHKEKAKSLHFNVKTETNNDRIFTNFIEIANSGNINEKFSIAVANTKVRLENIFEAIVDLPNVSEARSNQLIHILNQAEEVKADALILPEVCFPFQYIYQIADEARRKQRLIIVGLEHLRINNICYNFIATCLPTEYNGIKDVIVVFRLKNHYSPNEQAIIIDQGKQIPRQNQATYNLFKWRDLYFSVYNCYELADILHRSIFKSKVDLLFASEYNQDVNYFSNIVESVSRDVHCYFVQANTSNYGDSRITAPKKTAIKDILRLKGGENDVVLLAKIDINELRLFQATRIRGQDTRIFKNTPPNYNHTDAENRLGRN